MKFNISRSHARRITWFIAIFVAVLLLPSPNQADQTGVVDGAEPPSYSEQATALLEQIQESKERIKGLEARAAEQQGLAALVLGNRIQLETHRALQLSHQLCKLVIDREAAQGDPGAFRKSAVEFLQLIPERVRVGMQSQLALEDFGTDITELSAVDQVSLEDDRAELSKRLLDALRLLLINLQLSEQLGLDVTQQRDFITDLLSEVAENQSISLSLARRYGKRLERLARALPDDAELKAKVRISDERRRRLNDGLRQLVDLMKQLDMRTVEYQQQLVAVTGTVTTDILDIEVFSGMLQSWANTILAWMKAKLPGYGFDLLLFLLFLWIAFVLARFARRLVKSSLDRRPGKTSQLLRRMLISSAGNIVLIVGLLFGLTQLGVSVGPLLTGLGIAGFIVGFALQDSLGNFASGVLILIYRPYDVGDFIETNGVLGKVSRMSMVNTTVLTIDNQTLVLPNSKIWGDVIKNVTAQSERRVDMVFSIGYAEDIAKAETVLNEIVHDHPKVLEDPAPVVRLHTLNESSVDFVVRPWVKTEDYWDVYWDITRTVKVRFDENDISIPFPQRDIHLYAAENRGASIIGKINTVQPPAPIEGSEPGDDPPSTQN